MITFPYAVKYNGVIYPANTPIEEIKVEPLEVPEETPDVEVPEETPEENKKPSRKKGD